MMSQERSVKVELCKVTKYQSAIIVAADNVIRVNRSGGLARSSFATGVILTFMGCRVGQAR